MNLTYVSMYVCNLIIYAYSIFSFKYSNAVLLSFPSCIINLRITYCLEITQTWIPSTLTSFISLTFHPILSYLVESFSHRNITLSDIAQSSVPSSVSKILSNNITANNKTSIATCVSSSSLKEVRKLFILVFMMILYSSPCMKVREQLRILCSNLTNSTTCTGLLILLRCTCKILRTTWWFPHQNMARPSRLYFIIYHQINISISLPQPYLYI